METRQLDTLEPEEEGVVVRVDALSDRHRLFEMGFVPGTTVSVVAVAPLGDPMEVTLRGYRLAVRRAEAAHVTLTVVRPGRVPEPVVPRTAGGGEGSGADGPRRRLHRRIYEPGMRRRARASCPGAAATPTGPPAPIGGA